MSTVRFREGPYLIQRGFFGQNVRVLSGKLSVWRGTTVNEFSCSGKRKNVRVKPIVALVIVLCRFFLEEYRLFGALFFTANPDFSSDCTFTLFNSPVVAFQCQVGSVLRVTLFQ